ncbi:MAG: hypothetical protein N2512_02535 [Armatimonadetes bacterium]|nr:hypothetical protein [Armatimonadota bacterium]
MKFCVPSFASECTSEALQKLFQQYPEKTEYCQQLIIPPVVIYFLCAWLFLEGTILLTVQAPWLLVVDALTVMGIGVLNVVGGIFILGVLQMGAAINTVKRYYHYLALLPAPSTLETFREKVESQESRAGVQNGHTGR